MVKRAIPWPEDFPNVLVHTSIPYLKRHQDYCAAKSGDVDAANRLVLGLIKEERILAMADYFHNPVVVSVHAQEALGRNKIPVSYAAAIATVSGLEVDDDIVQTCTGGHTGADAATRFLSRSTFSGQVEPGRSYIMVDDVVTQGGSLSDLRQFIELNGGRVVAASTLAADFHHYLGPSTELAIRVETVVALERKFGRVGLENLLHENTIPTPLEALTNAEGRWLCCFSSLGNVRNRLAEARQENGRRPEQGIFPECIPARSAEKTRIANQAVLPWGEPSHRTKGETFRRFIAERSRGLLGTRPNERGLEIGED